MIVLDASAMVKLIIDEPHSDFARKKVDTEAKEDEPIYAPDVALAETINVIWKYSALKGREAVEPYKALADLLLVWDRITIVNTEELASIALKLSIEHRMVIYDALYAALSKLYRAPLFTFDKKLENKANEIGIELVTQ